MADEIVVSREQQTELMRLLSWYANGHWAAFMQDVLCLTLEPHQRKIVELVQEHGRVEARTCHGAGKATALDTPIPTPDGWSTMGDLKVGDELFDEQGRVCNVVWVGPDEWRDTYKVTFDDGTHIIAADTHNWLAMTARARGTVRERRRQAGFPKITDWRNHWEVAGLFETKDFVRTHIGNGKNRLANWAIPCTKPLQGKTNWLPVHPYVLGAWLGDGTSCNSQITLHGKDGLEIGGYLREFGISLGKTFANYDSTKKKASSVTLGSHTGYRLSMLNVLNNKHIPQKYLRASVEDRLLLLQGLMDTDGFYDHGGQVGIEVANHRLHLGIVELIRSLGWIVHTSTKRAKIYEKDYGLVYRCWFRPNRSVFKLSRKDLAWKEGTLDISMDCQNTIRTVRSVEKIPTVVTRCIEVDSASHLFLAGEGMIPTHNTFTAAALVLTVQTLYPYATTFTTAPTNRQVETLLWAEIGRRFNSSLLPELGFPAPMTKTWKIAKGWAAYGASSDEAHNVEGYHSPTLMFVVVDEAKGVDDKIFQALEGTMNAPINKQLRISTPGPAFGEHYECSLGKKRNLWEHLHITAPEIERLKKWAEERKAEWGEDSPVYRMRVLAEYADENSMKVFDARCLRLFEENATRVRGEGKRIMGVDVSRLGDDATVFTYRTGDLFIGQETFKGRRTDEVADLVAERIKTKKLDLVVIDAIGYGGGVLDNLARMGMEGKVEPFHANNTAFDPLYFNRKAEAAFKIRKRMEAGEIGGALTPDLKHDLESYDYLPTNKDQLRVYDPEGGGTSSPDFGDSFIYAFSVDDSSAPAWAQVSDEKSVDKQRKMDEQLFAVQAERKSILEEASNGRLFEKGERGRFFGAFR